MKSLKEQIQEATEKAGYWLHLGNLASERGDDEKAERHYARSQKWHDLMIDLSGEGDSDHPISKERANAEKAA